MDIRIRLPLDDRSVGTKRAVAVPRASTSRLCNQGASVTRPFFTVLAMLSLALADTPLRAESTRVDAAPPEAATPVTPLTGVQVIGRRANLIGAAISASEGEVGVTELKERPRLRPGDLVEYVPGMIATQHSGSGKANQYFLRGFNLDHGTDFATSVDGMPVNLRSHGHGQGYSDLNFLIPEMVERLVYRKGTYYADVGDFSSAGSVNFELAERLDSQRLVLGLGSEGYARGLALGGMSGERAVLTYGLEAQTFDGAWTDIDEDVRKRNLIVKTTFDVGDGQAHATVMAYRNRWNSPDQVPARAVDSGLIDALGSLDTDLGGASERRSLSAGWGGSSGIGEFEANAYAIDYELDLWSNFTYFLDDPVDGDEFRQRDQRSVYGFDVSDTLSFERWRVRGGLSGRRDDIDHVGLCRTVARRCVTPVRDDAVVEDSLGVWLDAEYRFSEQLRGYLGLRHDRYDFDVAAIEAENSGSAQASISSPKASLIYAPAHSLELYASWGEGFHSNDARGATLHLDPVSGEPADPVTPLARSRGSELGARLFVSERMHATLSLWQLDLESELLYVGDAGTTEANRPSDRRGAELGLYWFADERYSGELEMQYTRSRFADDDPAGDHIPGAVPFTVSAGINGRWDHGWNATLRWRHVGAYPLIEDDSQRAAGSEMLNLRVGRELGAWNIDLELLNLLDSEDHDIEYYYASRLPDEPDAGIEDRHFHVFEPRALRLSVSYAFGD